MPAKNIFLFSIDLEDARENVTDGHKYTDRVLENTTLFLNWLKKYDANCTFFTVGKIAESHPNLIKQLAVSGHEIACHSYSHTPVVTLGKEDFKRDLEKNINALLKAGASDIKGFRAPVFSLTRECEWAYDILSEFGFTYSSSVLPAKNPLYGWEGFGNDYKVMSGGIIEIPMTISNFGPLRMPIAGGVYFRVLPNYLIHKAIKKKFEESRPVLSYFHPYDVDSEQERFMHAGINDNSFFNYLLYYNRKGMIGRLDKLMNTFKPSILTYKKYTEDLKHGL
jgi:polysaccharide deacetylase family protein (PEP-CTERM system associated)